MTSDGERSARQYDAMARDYDADNAANPWNAYYERPGIISLLGDVTGRRVLEIGCGAGLLTSWLVERGAEVTGVDVSPEMVRLAERCAAGKAKLVVADLGEPLSFASDAAYDLVVGSLVLHYVRDWVPLLKELRRVLAVGGAVVFSTHHPALDWQLSSPEDYFALKQVTENWDKGAGSYEVTFWRRPLRDMTSAIFAAGLAIERLEEPEPLPELEDRDPDAYRLLQVGPRFLFFRLVPLAPAPGRR
jgi:SAM-dependent methyltransferase